MTTATASIVTALSDGPATARDLSQRLDGIGYANIRQALRRLAAAGAVTKLRRGLYAVGPGVPEQDAGKPAASDIGLTRKDGELEQPRRHTITAEGWSRALACIMADFDAMNDPRDPRAWA